MSVHRAESTTAVLPALTVVVLAMSVPLPGQQSMQVDQSSGAELRARGTSAAAVTTVGSAGSVRGTAVDASGGVLPGVTITATAADGQPLGSAVTDRAGEFVLADVPAGAVVLTFRLGGFDEARLETVVRMAPPAGGLRDEPIVQRMDMVGVAEDVVVRGDPPRPPPPPPRRSADPVPDHDQSAVCGPSKADGPLPTLGAIRSRNDDETKGLYAAGDVLLIEGGTSTGLTAGRNFIVRRRYPTAVREGRNVVVMGEHSSGLLQVVDVQEEFATAVVVYACDEMMRGDYLVPFEFEPIRPPEPRGEPDFDDAARILFADAGQPLGVTGRMMVIGRGSRDDIRVGQRLTLFRRSRFGDGRPLVLGEALVVAVRHDSSTFRIEYATDAIFFGERGDWAAPQQPARAGM